MSDSVSLIKLFLVSLVLVLVVSSASLSAKAQRGTGTGGKKPPQPSTSSKTKSKGNISKKSIKAANQPPKSKKEPNPMSANSRPKLWITYAWDNAKGGSFDFLVQKLESTGIQVIFDKVALIPGQRLWEQIAKRIEDPDLSGWAILLTKESVQSEACKEEVAYALDRAIHTKGNAFPMLGLVHQIGIQELPASLRTRLLIDLRDANWPKLVMAGLKQAPPQQVTSEPSTYLWEVFQNYEGDDSKIAVWVRPRFGELRHWRFIFPAVSDFIGTNIGAPQHGLAGIRNHTMKYEGVMTVEDNDYPVKVDGSGDLATPGSGCFIVFRKPIPAFVVFGVAKGWNPDKPDEIDGATTEVLWLTKKQPWPKY